MNTTIVEIPSEVQTYAQSDMLTMEGWCSTEKALELAASVMETKPQVAVEIGVFAGRSLIAIALALKELGVGTVIGIDPWKCEDSIEGFNDENREWWGKLDHETIYQQCTASISQHDLKNVRLFRQTAVQCIAEGHIPERIDFLHIDGNHSELSSCRDVCLYVPRVSRGAPVFFDDCDWKTTKSAQNLLAQFCDLERTIFSGTSICGMYRKR